MKNIFLVLKVFTAIIAILIFLAGTVLTFLGGYEFWSVFTHFETADKHQLVGLMAIGLLRVVDLFLITIVFFVLALGIMVLFRSPDKPLPIKLPEWLWVKNFMQLKMILWEAILTTLVVSYLSGMAQVRIRGEEIKMDSLLIPGGILMIALSLFFLTRHQK
jgi:uncharacterized membrane protein YqhA